MAEKLVSAGVFTQENDLTYLPQGVAAIGAAIVGPTPIGPAFIPTLIENQNDFITVFGNPDGKSYVPYAVQQYLKNAGRVTVVRVVSLDGYKSDALGLELTGSATASLPIFLIGSGSTTATNITASQIGTNTLLFTLTSGSTNILVKTASIDPSSTLWLPTMLGTSLATSVTGGFYVSASYSSNASSILAITTTNSAIVSPRVEFGSSSLGILSVTGSAGLNTAKTLCVLAPTVETGIISGSSGAEWSISALTNGLDFTLANTPAISYSLSLNPSSNNYVTNVLGIDPNGTKNLYVYANYASKHDEIVTALAGATTYNTVVSTTRYAGTGTGTSGTSGIQLSASLTSSYLEAKTPWIQSQTINGAKINLFRFNTFNVGTSAYKISISDIKMPTEMAPGVNYGTFTVLVRDINDIDTRPVVLETYTGCTLDPTSTNYIAKKIGNQYRTYSADVDGNYKLYTYGDFVNKSKRIYVELNTVDDIPANAMPFGFGNYTKPIVGNAFLPDLKTISTQYSNTQFNYRTYLGVDFTVDDVDTLNLPYMSSAQVTTAFSLENCYMSNAAGTSQVAFETTSSNGTSTNGRKARKFTVAFQGGFDGMNPTIDKAFAENVTSATNVMGFNVEYGTASGTTAFKRAIDTLASPDEFDINMLVIPGLTNDLAPLVIDYANNMCEERADVFFLFDSTQAIATVNEAVSSVQEIDSNYSATYYPWVKIYDEINQKYIWVPPSVVMAGVISFNDRVAAEWWAPAGLTRGGLDVVTQVYNRLTQAERDTLYEGRVNPIASFTGLGFAAWGQKTLQLKSSALDRINVRRLLIALKKYIASASKYLVFEQNTVATRTRFLNIANPYLASVQQKQGLYAFKVVMDETNNTPDLIDKNILKGEIFIQPAKTAEFIVIDFNVLPTGATFSQ